MTAPIQAELNFTSEPSVPDAFELSGVTRLSTGEPLYLSSYTVPIHDLRALSRKPSLDEEGFTWASIPIDDQDGSDGWEERYADAVCEWLKDYLGARAVRHPNYHLRREPFIPPNPSMDNELKEKVNDAKRPALAVHCDINRERAESYLLEPFESDEGSINVEGERLAIINVWKPLGNTVKDAPLALCDGRFLDPADMEQTMDVFGGGYFIRSNSNQKWFYLRDQTPHEVLIFRQYDSTLEYGKQAGVIPHSAFIDKDRKDEGPYRQSIEVRCGVIY